MINVKMSRQAMKEIASIIGIDQEAHVCAMNISMPLGNAVHIHVEFFVTEDQWNQLGHIVKKGSD